MAQVDELSEFNRVDTLAYQRGYQLFRDHAHAPYYALHVVSPTIIGTLAEIEQQLKNCH